MANENMKCSIADDDGNNSWPEVLKFLFDCASSGSAGLRESALHILTYDALNMFY